MSEMTTIARPYAKAIFEHALADQKLSSWSLILQELAEAVFLPEAKSFIANPTVQAELQNKMMMSLFLQSSFKDDLDAIENLIALLVENKRLLILPAISVQFEALRAEQEKTLIATVCSYSPLSAAQQQQLIQSLSQRLQRKISLEIKIDQSLIGGAVIRAGDLVIDGSVRGKLNKLATDLAA